MNALRDLLSRLPLPGLMLLAISAGGCSSAEKPEAPLAEVAQSVGLGDAIQFHDTPDAVDVPLQADAELSLPLATRRALETSASQQQSLAKVRAAQADAWQSRLLPNPILSVAVRLPSSGSGKPDIEAGLAADLLSLLQRPGRISAADSRLRSSCAEAVAAALDTIAEVDEHYTAATALESSLAILQQRLALLGKIRDLAKARLGAGEGTQLDLTTLQAQEVELETELAEHQQELADERLILARLIGTPSGRSDWRLSTPLGASPAALPSESSLLYDATYRRPEIQAVTWELAALGADLRLAGFAAFDGASVGVDAERDDRWTVGPAISTPLPIFDWGQAKRDKLGAERLQAAHKLTQVQRTVIEDVRRARTSVLAARATGDRVRRELIPLQQRRREQAESAYHAGLADITTLLLADNDLQAARAKLVDLDRKTALSLSKLRRATGGSLPAAAAPSTAPATAPSTGPSTPF